MSRSSQASARGLRLSRPRSDANSVKVQRVLTKREDRHRTRPAEMEEEARRIMRINSESANSPAGFLSKMG